MSKLLTFLIWLQIESYSRYIDYLSDESLEYQELYQRFFWYNWWKFKIYSDPSWPDGEADSIIYNFNVITK